MRAAEKGHQEMVNVLLQGGGDATLQNKVCECMSTGAECVWRMASKYKRIVHVDVSFVQGRKTALDLAGTRENRNILKQSAGMLLLLMFKLCVFCRLRNLRPDISCT